MSDEKRAAYRITEDALVDIKPVPAGHDLAKPVESLFDTGVAADSMSRFSDLDKGFRECHARLARQDALAAETANWLAAQIDLLKDIVLASNLRAESNMRYVQVSLGANGIGLTYESSIPVGSIVAIHLVLLPQHEAVLGYACIRQCRADSSQFAIGAEFVGLGEDYQRRLNRHMLKSQISSRSAKAH